MRFALTSFASLMTIGFLIVLVGCQPQEEAPVEPTATPETEATSVSFANTECPIMGGEPSPELTAEYKGQTIGFCCDGCPQKWAKLSAEEKAEKFAAVKKDGSATSHGDQDHADQDHSDPDHADHGEMDQGDRETEAAEATAPQASDA